ncbi:MAG TPA: 3-hydroxyacyl-CoA dehydrogenase family protein [Vicinamibacterales bacterium]|jgi:3-hydroxybutyryl-CoA dehydrogenase
MRLETIGVVGAGTIGRSVVTDLLLHGFQAVVVDLSEAALESAKANVLLNVRAAPLLSHSLPKVSIEDAAARLTVATRLEALALCDFVIENVTEDWDIKKCVYERLDRVVRPGVCFGVNTSCLSITRLASQTGRPADVAGLHLMNPVHLKNTVEVIRGSHTSDRTLAVIDALLSRLNKQAVVVGDWPGFVSSRLSHVFMNEAAFTLQENVATAEQIDTIFRQCYGHKMGPLETADLIGLDTVMRSLEVLYTSFQDPKYRCCPLLSRLVAAGHLGRKTGRGFYRYADSL